MIEGQSWHFFQPRLRHLVRHEQKNGLLAPWIYLSQYGVQGLDITGSIVFTQTLIRRGWVLESADIKSKTRPCLILQV